MHKLGRRIVTTLLCVGITLALPFTASATAGDCSSENEQHIWDTLLELTGNPIGAAGIMGNLYYESFFCPTMLENAEIPDGYDNESYTAAVDSGEYSDFTKDGIGYGLAQWTDPSRKAGLVKLAQDQGKSIGDLDLQLEYIGKELEKFNMLYRLSHADSIRFASDYFLLHYENPTIQDEEMQKRRAKLGRSFYDKYTNDTETSEVAADGLTQAQRDVIDVAMNSGTYDISADLGYCQKWVTMVYSEAGLPISPAASAAASAEAYGYNTDLSSVPAGAVVYGYSNSQYGHVGIYVGNGQVYHNIGRVAVDSLESWIDTYSGYGWGWAGGVDLSALS